MRKENRKMRRRRIKNEVALEKLAVAVTSSNASAKDIKTSMRKLEKMGVEVLLSPLTKEIINKNVRRPNFVEPYSTPERRYDDFVWAVEQNPDIIVALTGGNGAGELIPFIKKDIEYFKEKNIALMGFSDVTVLVNLWAFLGNPAYIGPCFEDADELPNTIKNLMEENEFILPFSSAEHGKMKTSGNDEKKKKEEKEEKIEELKAKMAGVWGGNVGSFISFLIADIEVDGKTPKDIKEGNPVFVFEETFEGYNRTGAEFTFDWIAELLLTSGVSEKFMAWGKIQKPREVEKKYFKTMVLKRSFGISIFDLEFGHNGADEVVIPIGYNVEAEVRLEPEDEEGEVIFRPKWTKRKDLSGNKKGKGGEEI